MNANSFTPGHRALAENAASLLTLIGAAAVVKARRPVVTRRGRYTKPSPSDATASIMFSSTQLPPSMKVLAVPSAGTRTMTGAP